MGILVWDELDANGRPIEIDPKEVKSYRKLANKVLSSLQGYLCKMAADAKNSFFVYFSTEDKYMVYESRERYAYKKRKVLGGSDSFDEESSFSVYMYKFEGYAYPFVVPSPFGEESVLSTNNIYIDALDVYKYDKRLEGFVSAESVELCKSLIDLMTSSRGNGTTILKGISGYIQEGFKDIYLKDKTVHEKAYKMGNDLSEFKYEDIYVGCKTYESFCRDDYNRDFEIPCYDTVHGDRLYLESGIIGYEFLRVIGVSYAFTRNPGNRASQNYISPNIDVKDLVRSVSEVIKSLYVSMREDLSKSDNMGKYESKVAIGDKEIVLLKEDGKMKLRIGYFKVEGRSSIGSYGGKVGFQITDERACIIVKNGEDESVKEIGNCCNLIAVPIYSLIFLLTQRHLIVEKSRELIAKYNKDVRESLVNEVKTDNCIQDSCSEVLNAKGGLQENKDKGNNRIVDNFTSLYRDTKVTFGEAIKMMEDLGYSDMDIFNAVKVVLKDVIWDGYKR